ncbi:MAG: hypothetical protein IJ760_00805 [Bacteroidales bacterium]|nr:hypothetical protein [Bacteroidales bacterium]
MDTSLYYPPLFVLLLIIMCKRRKSAYIVPVAFAVLCCLVSVALRPFPHYVMAIVPVMVVVLGVSDVRHKWLWVVFLCVINRGELYSSVMRVRREVCLHRVWYKEGYERFDAFVDGLSEEERGSMFNFIDWQGLSLMNRKGVVQCNRNTITDAEEEFHRMRSCGDAEAMPRWVIVSTAGKIADTTRAYLAQHYTDTVDIGDVAWSHVYCLGIDVGTYSD